MRKITEIVEQYTQHPYPPHQRHKLWLVHYRVQLASKKPRRLTLEVWAEDELGAYKEVTERWKKYDRWHRNGRLSGIAAETD